MAADIETIERLRSMAGVDWPDAELDIYLEQALVADDEGRRPGDEDYVDTYDLHRAAARIFQDRAAEIADVAYDIQVDMTKRNASGIFKNYIRMARYHEMRSIPQGVSIFALHAGAEPQDNVSPDV